VHALGLTAQGVGPRADSQTMQRVSRILIILAALSLFASACGGSSTQSASDAPDGAETETRIDGSESDDSDTGDAAPEELAKREPLGLLDDAIADESAVERDGDTSSTEDASDEDASSTEDASDEGIILNSGVIEEPIGVAVNEAATCVTTALDASPELREAWDDILRDDAASLPDDSAAVMDPILECVTFGSVVADVIEREDGVTLSDSSVGCIDDAVSGREDLLVSLIGDDASGAIDEDLLVAMVRCVSDEELTALMG